MGKLPQLCAGYAPGNTMDEMLENIREVIALCVEENPQAMDQMPEFIGIQKIVV